MKLGIIGAGQIVSDFLTIAHHLKGMELTAIAGRESSKQRMLDFQNTYGIESIYVDNDAMIQSDVDTVYIALPNSLHFEYAKKVLEANKNVIVEKPMTTTVEEANLLNRMARERQVFIFEAITNQYLPNYHKIRTLLPSLGEIKIVQCNYSQYSSRYDKFKAGEVLPAFDPKHAGGALMDLNVYNIHYVVGLFGKPEDVAYYGNIERGIDTSGILMLDYGSFKCVCIGAKDCKAPITINIQGDCGCIHQRTPANVCKAFEFLDNDGNTTLFNENTYEHRMVDEFLAFIEMIENKDFDTCYRMLDHSLTVSEILTKARRGSGVLFPQDSPFI